MDKREKHKKIKREYKGRIHMKNMFSLRRLCNVLACIDCFILCTSVSFDTISSLLFVFSDHFIIDI